MFPLQGVPGLGFTIDLFFQKKRFHFPGFCLHSGFGLRQAESWYRKYPEECELVLQNQCSTGLEGRLVV